MTKPTTILMCPPTYFDIKYEINPWMDTTKKVNQSLAQKQWKTLKATFLKLGHTVKLIPPAPNLPDMTYVDAGIISKNLFIPSNFKYQERRGERQHFIVWFQNHHYTIKPIPQKYHFEGHGDTLLVNNKLFFGYGFRSSLKAHHQIAPILKSHNIEIIPIKLQSSHFYHLDTCLCPLDTTHALYISQAFSAQTTQTLKKHFTLIKVPASEVFQFPCNSVVLNNHIIIPQGNKKTCTILHKLGYHTHQIPMSEFLKGGGACKCLSLPL